MSQTSIEKFDNLRKLMVELAHIGFASVLSGSDDGLLTLTIKENGYKKKNGR